MCSAQVCFITGVLAVFSTGVFSISVLGLFSTGVFSTGVFSTGEFSSGVSALTTSGALRRTFSFGS